MAEDDRLHPHLPCSAACAENTYAVQSSIKPLPDDAVFSFVFPVASQMEVSPEVVTTALSDFETCVSLVRLLFAAEMEFKLLLLP